MTQVWHRIERWIEVNSPSILATLNPGATEDEFVQVESLIKQKLPEQFKTFLSIHNGQTWTHRNLFDSDRFLSIEDIITDWQHLVSATRKINVDCLAMFGESINSLPEKGIKNDWWNSAWIPITSDGSGNCYCIDFDPTSEGTVGQIIRMWHDDPDRQLISSSFGQWIDNYVYDLENGVYIPSDDGGWGGIVRKDA